MRALAHRCIVHFEVAPDGTYHHFSRVHANSNLYWNSLGLLNSFGILFHRLLHPECGVTGAHRVVLMSQRRTEEGHYPVAHHLVYGSFVAMHGFHHLFENWIENLPGFLWITISEQFHGTLHVREQNRDLLALAFEGTFGGEDFFSEMLRGIDFRRSEAQGYGRVST